MHHIQSTETMPAIALASKYKGRGIDRQAAYSNFVRDRNLKPEMDANDFFVLFDKAIPCYDSVNVVNVTFTHWIRLKGGLPFQCQLISNNKSKEGVVRYINQSGVNCSEPAGLVEIVEPLVKEWDAEYIYEEAVKVECAMHDDISDAELSQLKLRAQYLLFKLNEDCENTSANFGWAAKNLEDSINWTR